MKYEWAIKNDENDTIDMEWVGKNLKRLITKNGYNVKYIQDYLHLSCPQPIYRWFKGKTLPSVDHLYALSKLLHVHMEELLVPSWRIIIERLERDNAKKKVMQRMFAYYNAIQKYT